MSRSWNPRIKENGMKEAILKRAYNPNGVYCVEDLLNQSGGGLFSLVRVAMARSAELAGGKPSLLEKPSTNKIITTVFEEIANGLVVVKEKAGK